jgi:hypothetical protein
MLRRLCAAAAAFGLLSCTASKPPAATPPVEPPRTLPQNSSEPVGAPGIPAPGYYHVDSSHSELRLLVYRAGALANLGHNHVIVNRSLNGSIDVAPQWGGSSFSLSVPVAAFVIDDSQARSEEGEDFAAEVSDGAKAGTWNNMTGPAVLDAARYPVIGMRSVRLEERQGIFTVTVAVSVAGHEASVSEPFVLRQESDGLSATAAFDLNQSALGMTPFSVMLGALAVRDTMRVKLTVTAQLDTPR